jgi:hypothetical protein
MESQVLSDNAIGRAQLVSDTDSSGLAHCGDNRHAEVTAIASNYGESFRDGNQTS